MKRARSAKRFLCIWFPDGPVAEGRDQGDLAASQEVLKQLAIWCEQFSPVVALGPAVIVDEPSGNNEAGSSKQASQWLHDTLLLDVTGLAHLFGGEELLARLVVQQFDQRGFQVWVVVAATIGAAWGLARYGFQISDTGIEGSDCDGSDCRFRIYASEAHDALEPTQASLPHSALSIPPSAFRLPPSILPLAVLPLAALRLPVATVELLAGLGIRTVAELAELPRDQLSARFGSELLLRLDQATGAREEVLHAVHAHPPVSAECLLETPTYRRDTIRQILIQLITRVTDQLAARGQGVLAVVCRLERQAGGPLEIPIGLYRPSVRPRHLVDLADLQLERLRLHEPITAVGVVATATALLEAEQQALFATSREDRTNRIRADERRQLGQLIDRLSSRLGRDAVSSPRLVRDAIPERAFRLQPLTGKENRSPSVHRQPGIQQPRAQQQSPSQRRPFAAFCRLRPLWLEPSPPVLHSIVTATDGRPLRFRRGVRQYEIIHCWGPERIETGWWRRRSPRQVRRDYYRVETNTGQRFWLFCRHEDGQWFLHGEFD